MTLVKHKNSVQQLIESVKKVDIPKGHLMCHCCENDCALSSRGTKCRGDLNSG